MTVRIEPARVEQAERILALQKLANLSEAKIYDNYQIPPLTQTLEELIAQFDDHTILVALDGGTLAGSVRARLQDGTAHIGRLIVAPSLQGRGLGKQLMAEIEASFAPGTDFELFTGRDSVANLALYQTLGYAVVRQAEKIGDMVFLRKPAK